MRKRNYLLIILVFIGLSEISGQTPLKTYIKASDTAIKYPSGLKNSTDNVVLQKALQEKYLQTLDMSRKILCMNTPLVFFEENAMISSSMMRILNLSTMMTLNPAVSLA